MGARLSALSDLLWCIWRRAHTGVDAAGAGGRATQVRPVTHTGSLWGVPGKGPLCLVKPLLSPFLGQAPLTGELMLGATAAILGP